MSNYHHQPNIVIVGAGVIGLSAAYNLAKNASQDHLKIDVIDASTEIFAAASSCCTGCFHYGFPESETQPLKPLGKYSFDLWESIAKEDRAFRIATGYRQHSCFGIDRGEGRGLDRLPDWVTKDPTWDVDPEVLGVRNATV